MVKIIFESSRIADKNACKILLDKQYSANVFSIECGNVIVRV